MSCRSIFKKSLFKSSFVSVSALFVLVGCGSPQSPEAKPSKVQTSTQSAPPKSTESAAAVKVTETLVLPKEIAGNWRRKIRFETFQQAGITIEKYVPNSLGGEWRMVGLTDAQGEWLDDDIAIGTRYRLGGKLESQNFEGVADTLISGALTENKTIKGRRVVVTGDIYLGNHTLVIEAPTVYLRYNIYAFPKGNETGAKAGALSINAGSVEGPGRIELSGERGTTGLVGGKGADGVSQTCDQLDRAKSYGQKGGEGQVPGLSGAGGEVTIFAAEMTLKNISVEGGAPGSIGKGGPGGNGQLQRTCTDDVLVRLCAANKATIDKTCPYGSEVGPRGKTGGDSAPGKAGEAGHYYLYNKKTF